MKTFRRESRLRVYQIRRARINPSRRANSFLYWTREFNQEAMMARGSKKKYTSKQKRKAEHIEEGYEKRGVSKTEAEKRAWATVNKSDKGGKKSGSGRGKKSSKASSRKGGKKGGKKSGGKKKR
ncbi:MAG TPA: hypothetical protein VJS88_00080 [Chthoniobacterales bacterium]|nr:hypothetical protein [Chthoniobacterales bacterium]